MKSKKAKSHNLAEALEEHGAEGVEILTSEPSRLFQWTLYIMIALLLVALAWSFVGRADVIVKANGKLGPELKEQNVYAPIEGDVVDVYMTEGTPVQKGDPLVRINAIGAVELANKALAAELKLLDAQRRYQLFPVQKKAMEQRLDMLRKQIEAEEKAHEQRVTQTMAKLAEEEKVKLEKARAKLEKAKGEMEHAKRVAAKYQRLYRSPDGGGVAKKDVVDKQKDYQGKLVDYRLAKAELAEFEIQMNKKYLEKQEDIQKKAENLMSLYVQYEEQAYKIKQQELRTEMELRQAQLEADASARVKFEDIDEENFLLVSAPVNGIVTTAHVTHAGDRVETKRPVAGIAPRNAPMILHIDIEEKDRGFLREGMPVKMKFNAFPYQRYGFIKGKLLYISPSANINRDTKKLVYNGRVSLDERHFTVGDAQMPLRYGMSAVAEIVVRKRRLIDVALDPFRKVVG